MKNNEEKDTSSGGSGKSQASKVNDLEKWKFLMPAVIVGSMVAIYIVLGFFFIQCPGKCQKIDGELISVVDDKKRIYLDNSNLKPSETNTSHSNTESTSNNGKSDNTNSSNTNILNTKTPATNSSPSGTNSNTTNQPPPSPINGNTNVNLAAVKAQVDKLREETDKLPVSGLIKSVENLEKQFSGAQPTPKKSNKSTNTKAKKTSTENKDAAADETLSEEEAEAVMLRGSISTRYTSRSSWVFLTMLLISLFFGALWFLKHILWDLLSDNDNRKEDFLRFKRGIFLVALIAFIAGLFVELYMPISDQMFSKTIYLFEGISGWWFAASNAIVFAAAVFLVAASCIIFYKVLDLNKQTKSDSERLIVLREKIGQLEEKESDEEVEKEKTAIEQECVVIRKKLSEYAHWENNSKYLLYIGGAILTVGLARIAALSAWHLAFIESQHESLLKSYFESSLNNQAVFYSILLLAIYLPITYNLPETPDSPSMENSLKRKGFLATITNFAPQILAVLSPALAALSIDFVKIFFTGQSE